MCHGSIAMSKITSGQNAVQRIQNWHGAIQGNAWQNEKAASSDSTLQRGLCTTGDHSRTETSSLRLGSPPQDVAAPLRRDLSRATFDLHIEILRATLVHVAHPRALEEVPTSSTSSRGATSSDLMFPLWTAAPYLKKKIHAPNQFMENSKIILGIPYSIYPYLGWSELGHSPANFMGFINTIVWETGNHADLAAESRSACFCCTSTWSMFNQRNSNRSYSC